MPYDNHDFGYFYQPARHIGPYARRRECECDKRCPTCGLPKPTITPYPQYPKYPIVTC